MKAYGISDPIKASITVSKHFLKRSSRSNQTQFEAKSEWAHRYENTAFVCP